MGYNIKATDGQAFSISSPSSRYQVSTRKKSNTMAFKLLIIGAFLAVNGGQTLASITENSYQSQSNLAQASADSKNAGTSYYGKTDSYETASVAPVYNQYYKSYQQPYNYHASPAAYTTGSYYPHQTYSAPVHSQQVYSAPVYTKSHVQPTTYQISQPAPYYTHHQAPVYSAPVAHQPLYKIHYSPATEVAHLSYSNANDHVTYSW